jgi:hypothetical protein
MYSKAISFHSIAYYASCEVGHFYHYHRAVQKAMELYGSEVFVYANREAKFEVTPRGWKKWFSSYYNTKLRKQFKEDCKRLFKQPSEGKRIFFIEFFCRRDFFLYAMAALLYARKDDILWILYRDDLAIRRKKNARVIRQMSKLLKLRFKKRLLPLTDSELLADYYQQWFRERPTVLPVIYPSVSISTSKPKEKLVCSWLGSPREEKGASEIARLVQFSDPQSAQIELDVSGAAYLPPIRNQITVSLRKAYLTETEYYASLHRSDVVLLPYDPERYRRKTSGVFVEAILCGKLTLAKGGSWIAYELNRFGLKELIVDWENPQFFSHLISLVNNVSLQQKLQTMQQAYQAFHGEENFARTLHSLCQ